MERYQKQAAIFKALMHPVRLAILDILRQGEACVCHIEMQLGYRQAYISQHLAVLREAGLVQDRRDGWNVFYQVASAEIFDLLEISTAMAGESLPALQASPNLENCPCPRCNHAV